MKQGHDLVLVWRKGGQVVKDVFQLRLLTITKLRRASHSVNPTAPRVIRTVVRFAGSFRIQGEWSMKSMVGHSSLIRCRSTAG